MRFLVGAVVQLVEYRTRNREVAGSTHTRSTASNLEQVANQLCAQANSASYPQRDGIWVVATATEWRPSVADWGLGAMVCLLAAPWVQLSVSAGNGWPHNALRHHWLMPVSCHFRDCKSAAGYESDSCKWRHNKCPDLYLYLYYAALCKCSVCYSYSVRLLTCDLRHQ